MRPVRSLLCQLVALPLGIPVILWISFHGLAKRFTRFCHVWLGSTLALSPVADTIAIEPAVLDRLNVSSADGFRASVFLVVETGHASAADKIVRATSEEHPHMPGVTVLHRVYAIYRVEHLVE